MDNSKKNIHSTGPLGILIKSGQIKKIEDSEKPEPKNIRQNISSLYFKTQSGVEFAEHELAYVDPRECEPWQYANRQEDELGDIDELIHSIKVNKQLQPALIRNHPAPHDNIKYEIIFGCRRHLACLKLAIPFLVILKDISNIQDAIASQDAENKLRNDVSNYSNAILYQRLLKDGVFKTEKELAGKLRLSTSTFNDLMAYAKIPEDIVKKIPNIHKLSKQIVIKLVQLLSKSKENYQKINEIADQLGKTITSEAKLERLLEKKSVTIALNESFATTYHSRAGKKLFTFKSDRRGLPSIVFSKQLTPSINFEELCRCFSEVLEARIEQSGYPD